MTNIQEYINDLVTECDTASSDEIREIIDRLSDMQTHIQKLADVTNLSFNDDNYFMLEFYDDVVGLLDESIVKAEKLMLATIEEEEEIAQETPNWSDVEYAR